MYTIGRDNIDGYDFRSEENLKKWRGFFIPTLQQIQKLTHPNLLAKEDGLLYVESLILRLLGAIISSSGSVSGGSSGMVVTTLHSIADLEDRIRRLIPDPLKTDSVQRAKEVLQAFRSHKKSKANSSFHGNDRSQLKTPVDKFHQLLQKDVLCYKTDVQVSQYLLAVLEFIATDILRLSGHYVGNMIHTDPSHGAITAQDIRVAMYADKYLMEIFCKDEDGDDGPPLSANYYYHQSFFDSDFADGEYGNIGNHSLTYSEAVHEFIQEERQFVRELSLMIKVFRDPLEYVLSEHDLQKIFVNIDDIYEFSIKFLGLLEDAVEVADEDASPALGSCFMEIAEDEEMDVFHKYAHNVMNFSYRDHLNYVLSQHSLSSQIADIFLSRYTAPGMMDALQYVLPRLLLLPIYHCFSYFKAIEKLKELTDDPKDRENYEQAESSLQSLRNDLEKQKKQNKFGDSYFLRLYGRTHRAAALAKMKEIQSSIDNWDGKDIWQSCNEFIREGVLYKDSHPGKSLGNLSTGRYTERRAFLFDGLLILCKPSNKRIGPGRGSSDNSQLEWRCKELFFIRKIDVLARDGFHLPSIPNFHFGLGSDTASTFNSIVDQSFSSLSSSVSNISHTTMSSSATQGQDVNGVTHHAFEISQLKPNKSIVLLAKTVEERDSWMAQLILLNKRSMLERALDSKLSEEANKHPLWLPHPSLYRFALEDIDTVNIILEENKSNPNVPLVKGATLLKLIERLTYHKYGDPVSVRIFLATYRSFCTPSELLKLLIERFEIPEPDFQSCMQAMHYANEEMLSSPTSMAAPTAVAPDSMSMNHTTITGPVDSHHQENGAADSSAAGMPTSPTSPTMSMSGGGGGGHHLPSLFELNMFFDEQDEQCQQDYREMLKRFRKEYAQPVQFRVLNVLRHWIDKHYYDFERDSQLLQMLNEFLDEKLAKSHTKVAKWCHHIRKVIERKQPENCGGGDIPVSGSETSQIVSNISMSNSIAALQEFDLFVFSPEAIAQHMTLYEFELYRAVQPFEFIGMDEQSCVWTKKYKQKTSPNLLKMIRHHSIMCFYFEKCIVEAKNFEERVAVWTRIVEIMIELLELNNFNGAFAIVAALFSAPIYRLEHTRACFERQSKLKKALEEAKELTEDHFKKYKEKLFSINPPCVPFVGNFLTNIVHLEEGNPDILTPHTDTTSMILDDKQMSTKLINFQKKRRVAETVSMIQQYQNEPYNKKPYMAAIWNFFENMHMVVFPDMDDKQIEDYLYEKSLEIEPRNCKQPPKFPKKWPDRNLKQLSKSKSNRLPAILPGIGHQSQSNHNGNHIGDVSDSLPQQASPSTPLTPPGAGSSIFSHDSIFAPVKIGAGGCGTPNHISPTTPSFQQSMSFFPTTSAAPPTPPHHPSSSSSQLHASSSSPLSPTEIASGSGAALAPPLPPRRNDRLGSAPPLPPRTYRKRPSYRDKGPPPLPPVPPPSSIPYHQRVNSDITPTSTSPHGNGGPSPFVRRNSTIETSGCLPPRRFSQGGVPPPPPLTPNTPSSSLFPLLPGGHHHPHHHHTTTPPSSAPPQPPTLHRAPLVPPTPTTPTAGSSATASSTTGPNSVPELPPKPYRLSNACR